jgi:hypothetical protein
MPYGMMEQQQRSRNLTPPVSSLDDNKNRGSFGTREQGRYPPPTPSDIQEQDAFTRNEKGRSFGAGSGFTQSSIVGRPLGLDDNGIGGGGGGLSSVSDTLSGKFEPSSSYGTPPPFRSPSSSTSLPIMKGSSSTTSGYTTTVPPQQRKGNNNASGGMSKSFGKSSYNKKG